MGPHLPARVVNLDAARAGYGDFPDRFLPSLWRGDPLADAVVEAYEGDPARLHTDLAVALNAGVDAVKDAPPALVNLFAALDHVPAWVDWAQVDHAGELLFRVGPASGMVLGARSLALSYCSPGGNKPLVMSGGLIAPGQVMRHRLTETSRFVANVCRTGGMRRHALGFAHTVRVRVMHARVRRTLLHDERWFTQTWGIPINQHDMVAATLLFSHAFIDGLRILGFIVSPDEAHGYLQLWRYNGYVMGVESELLPAHEGEARRLTECIELTQGRPDEDSRTLVRALVEAPPDPSASATFRRQARVRQTIGYGVVRLMLGEARSEALGLPRNVSQYVFPAIRRGVRTVERIEALVPGIRQRRVAAGRRYWARVIAPPPARPREPTTAG